MQLHTLTPRHKNIRFTVVGRGGKRGKTSGRGGKGQTARAGHKIRPEMRDLIKKIPKRRGHGRNRSRTVRKIRTHYAPVNIATLEALFPKDAVISPSLLLQKGIVKAVRGGTPKVKLLGTGDITKAFQIKNCSASASARAAILKVGGAFISEPSRSPVSNA